MIFSKETICLDLNAQNKEDVIERLCRKFKDANNLIADSDALSKFVSSVHQREKVSSTSLGLEFAIPHGKSSAVREPGLAFARLTHPVSWDEDEEVRFVFLVGVPESGAGNNDHLHILAKLSGAIMEDEFREQLEKAATSAEVLAIFEKYASN